MHDEEMPELKYLGEFELMVLMAVLRLGEGAYGVSLARELSELRGQEVAIGSVYAALERLERKGAVRSALGERTPERGGRAKRYFQLTDEGLRSVQETRRTLDALWRSIPSRTWNAGTPVPLGKETA